MNCGHLLLGKPVRIYCGRHSLVTSCSVISLLSTDLSDTVGGAGYGSSVTDVTGGLYEMPFDGCIRDISINTHNSEQLTQYTTTNVQSCNS